MMAGIYVGMVMVIAAAFGFFGYILGQFRERRRIDLAGATEDAEMLFDLKAALHKLTTLESRGQAASPSTTPEPTIFDLDITDEAEAEKIKAELMKVANEAVTPLRSLPSKPLQWDVPIPIHPSPAFSFSPGIAKLQRYREAAVAEPKIVLPEGHSSNYPPPSPKVNSAEFMEGVVSTADQPKGAIIPPQGQSGTAPPLRQEEGPILLPFGKMPPPVPNQQVSTWDLVIEDMKKRDAFGRAKYGVPVQPFNGRKALQDMYEELLDAVVYVRQELYEREHPQKPTLPPSA